MTDFDSALARHWLDTGSGGGGARVARAELGQGWVVGKPVNGGISLALAVDALREAMTSSEVGGVHPHPVAVSAHFLEAVQPGEVSVVTEPVRVGRSTSTGQVRLTQTGPDGIRDRLRALVTFADLDALAGPTHKAPEPPRMPPPEACIEALRMPGTFSAGIAILDRVEIRLDPRTAGWAIGSPSGDGEIRGWIRFRGGREPDLAALPFICDALPPVAFDLGAMGWAPTLELTGYLRNRPAPGWLQVQVRTSTVIGGLFEEDAVIWDSTGAVVAQSRQLAGIRMP